MANNCNSTINSENITSQAAVKENKTKQNIEIAVKSEQPRVVLNISQKLLVSKLETNEKKHGVTFQRSTAPSATLIKHNIRKHPEIIILISPLGRGGSSWIAKLLASSNNNLMYIFEPMKIVIDFYKQEVTREHSNKILTSIVTCQYDSDWTNYTKIWPHLWRKFPTPCKTDCYSPKSLNYQCNLAETYVTKVFIYIYIYVCNNCIYVSSVIYIYVHNYISMINVISSPHHTEN